MVDDDTVDPAERLAGVVRNLRYRLQVPEVTCNILDLRGVRRLELLELVLGPGGEDNSVRSLEEVLCNGEPEAAAGTCDDEDFGRHFGAGENALCSV